MLFQPECNSGGGGDTYRDYTPICIIQVGSLSIIERGDEAMPQDLPAAAGANPQGLGADSALAPANSDSSDKMSPANALREQNLRPFE